MVACSVTGGIMIGLVMRPTDATTIRVVSAGFCTGMCVLAFLLSLPFSLSPFERTKRGISAVIAAVAALLVGPAIFPCLLPPRVALRAFWLSLRFVYFAIGILLVTYDLVELHDGNTATEAAEPFVHRPCHTPTMAQHSS